jgi:hypothetical protein|nr:MAG TPA: Prohead core protein serine protease [Caudoviricetes sp.]
MKLIAEAAFDVSDYKTVIEESKIGSEKHVYIVGPYMAANEVNRNRRIYDLDEMLSESIRYGKEFISQNRAYGELNHPATPDVDLGRACHMVLELKQDGNVFTGKSKVLSTPCGTIVKNIIEDGGKVAVSTRALGELVPEANDINRVKSMRLVAVDVVHDPSCIRAFVNGILESKEYNITENGVDEVVYNGFERSLHHLPSHTDAKKEYIKENIMNFLKELTSNL